MQFFNFIFILLLWKHRIKQQQKKKIEKFLIKVKYFNKITKDIFVFELLNKFYLNIISLFYFNLKIHKLKFNFRKGNNKNKKK